MIYSNKITVFYYGYSKKYMKFLDITMEIMQCLKKERHYSSSIL